nr:uncharacterized protein LOC124815768 [Hydra vulgaris]
MINESIYDWYLALKDTSYDAIYCRYCLDFKVELFCCKKALAKKINRLVDTIRKLKKQRKNKKLALLLGEAFFPPVANFSDNTVSASEIPKETILISENKMLKKENNIFKRKMESMMDLQMDYFTHLKDFEGFSIQHRVREEDAHEVSWERAQVVQIDQLNGRRTTYLVKYDNESDEVWSFPLVIDF